jgi:hypothetical protein
MVGYKKIGHFSKFCNYRELLIHALEVIAPKQIPLRRTWYTKILQSVPPPPCPQAGNAKVYRNGHHWSWRCNVQSNTAHTYYFALVYKDYIVLLPRTPINLHVGLDIHSIWYYLLVFRLITPQLGNVKVERNGHNWSWSWEWHSIRPLGASEIVTPWSK